MPTHKSNDYKLTILQYYLVKIKHKKMFVKYLNALQEVL